MTSAARVIDPDDNSDGRRVHRACGERRLPSTRCTLTAHPGRCYGCALSPALREVSLTGSIGADGYFVVAPSSASEAITDEADPIDDLADLQNGPDGLQLRWGALVVDALGYGDAGEHFAGEGGHAADVAEGMSLGRDNASTDTDDNSADFVAYSEWTPGTWNGGDNALPTAAIACPDSGGACSGYASTWRGRRSAKTGWSASRGARSRSA